MTQAQENLGTNIPEMSVSELSGSLKRTIEGAFGRVRVRGELSRVTIARSGHMYSSLKDENAVLDAVCWKGVVSGLAVKPEEGLEVICTGKLTTYPGRSNYQLIIESMELAGEGALLKMLEDRRKKLEAEGLFDPSRKKKRPFLPKTIGVVTSPTGAVIRDILHRLNDRFPRHVLLWPVIVQGDKAAQQVSDAISGFNAMNDSGAIPKPDLLIVARGGGSLEDLMPFNEESVVRAVADSIIPVISAIGHETDTTLVDYAADLRAPTPTGAAEMAVPVRRDLIAQILDNEQRLIRSTGRMLQDFRTRIESLGRGLGDPQRFFETKSQRLDHAAISLERALIRGVEKRESRVKECAAKLRSPKQQLSEAMRHYKYHAERLHQAGTKILEPHKKQLAYQSSMLETLSFHKVLERGYVVVRDENGMPLTRAANTQSGQNIALQFYDDKKDAIINGTQTKTVKKTKKQTQPSSTNQGQLL